MAGKNQLTISRQLEAIRRVLFEDTKRRIKERLAVSSDEFVSILKIIESRFYVSIHQLLKESQPGDEPHPGRSRPESLALVEEELKKSLAAVSGEQRELLHRAYRDGVSKGNAPLIDELRQMLYEDTVRRLKERLGSDSSSGRAS